MARPEVTGRKVRTTHGKKKAGHKQSDTDADDDDEDGSYTVDEFCRRNKISLQAFYKHRPEMPRGYGTAQACVVEGKLCRTDSIK